VGPLPRELQKVTIYAAGVATKATAPDAAKTFIAYLTRPVSKTKFAAAGLDYTENDDGDTWILALRYDFGDRY
jgi:ABC-type Fe3+ transport system substrate-binding protein